MRAAIGKMPPPRPFPTTSMSGTTSKCSPLIVEALGGIGRRGARCLRFLARRASCRKRGRDGTTYSRFHPSNYLSHHLAGIVTAAVFSDAAHIVEEIALLKTRTSTVVSHLGSLLKVP